MTTTEQRCPACDAVAAYVTKWGERACHTHAVNPVPPLRTDVPGEPMEVGRASGRPMGQRFQEPLPATELGAGIVAGIRYDGADDAELARRIADVIQGERDNMRRLFDFYDIPTNPPVYTGMDSAVGSDACYAQEGEWRDGVFCVTRVGKVTVTEPVTDRGDNDDLTALVECARMYVRRLGREAERLLGPETRSAK